MPTTRTETITAADGGRFEAHLALPDAGHGPGVLLIQEIFGVNEYVRDVADRLARLGYVALAPDVFWRVEPGVDLAPVMDNLAPAMEIVAKWDPEAGLADLAAGFEHLRHLPEVRGPVGVVGFCFGGTQAFRLAKAQDPAAAVCYYGSGIGALLDDLDSLTCPVMLHFGDDDPYIPDDEVTAVRQALGARHNVTIHVHQGGGHAFDDRFAPHFSQPEIAARAWMETSSFLFLHLGGPGSGA
jgi:carboxymethylenebutenolidase